MSHVSAFVPVGTSKRSDRQKNINRRESVKWARKKAVLDLINWFREGRAGDGLRPDVSAELCKLWNRVIDSGWWSVVG